MAFYINFYEHFFECKSIAPSWVELLPRTGVNVANVAQIKEIN